MKIRILPAAVLAVIAAGFALSACTVQASTGNAPTTSAAAAPAAAVAPAPAPQTHTKTVIALPPAAAPAPAAAAPAAPLSLRQIVNSASPVDTSTYEQAHDGMGTGIAFLAPSGNIECFIMGGGASCSIAHYDFDQPGPDCPNGGSVAVDTNGVPGFTGCVSGLTRNMPTLAYGQSLREGSFTCSSASSGISCMNGDTGTGFTLTRQAFTQYP